jgi:hypothetical protein
MTSEKPFLSGKSQQKKYRTLSFLVAGRLKIYALQKNNTSRMLKAYKLSVICKDNSGNSESGPQYYIKKKKCKILQ